MGLYPQGTHFAWGERSLSSLELEFQAGGSAEAALLTGQAEDADTNGHGRIFRVDDVTGFGKFC